MRTYKVIIAYDGTKYQGWQRQTLVSNTVQQVLEETATQLLGYPIELNASGRTDAGVHARGQVASMKVSGKLKDDFMEEWNAILPADICVQELELMPAGFHGRYAAKSKCYSYLIDTREVPNVFQRKYTCHYPQRLNVDDMKKGARCLIGTHDFSAFTDDKSEKSKVRTIHKILVEEDGYMIKLSFWGDGFMYHMVRILAGTLLQIGSGEKKVEELPNILESKERNLAGFLAPAKGLCLEEVYY